MLIFKLSIIFTTIFFAESARILATVFTPSYSHQIVFRPIWKELAKRGHEIVLLTTDPMNDPTFPNIKEIDLNFSYKIMKKHNASNLVSQEGSKIKILKKWTAALSETALAQLEHPEVQEIINNKSEKFDLIMTEVVFPTHMGFVERFKVPFIGLTSLDAYTILHEAQGNPIHPIVTPDLNLPYISGELTFGQRLVSVLAQLFLMWYNKNIIYPGEDITVKKIFGPDTRSLLNIQMDMDLLFTNANPIFHPIRALTPTTINIGGGTHLVNNNPLPKDLQEYLDSAKDGAIYFSLGSNVKSNMLAPELQKLLMETFSELPYKILWKFEDKTLGKLPKNVMIKSWVPQNDVFNHPNIKLFITQCGLQSIEEAIFSHIPMVAIPFFADQHLNAKIVEKKGLGLQLLHKTLTKVELKEAIINVISNKKYKERVIETAKLIKDVDMTGLEKAVWWTEYVIRNRGAKHLKSPVIQMPYYKYFLLDVTAFILVILFVITYAIIKLISKTLSFLRSKIKRKTE